MLAEVSVLESDYTVCIVCVYVGGCIGVTQLHEV